MLFTTLVGLIVTKSVKCVRGRNYTAVGLTEADLCNLKVFKGLGTLNNFRVLNLRPTLSISVVTPKVRRLLNGQRCCMVAAAVDTSDILQLADHHGSVAGSQAFHS